jgi:hypothetical protein
MTTERPEWADYMIAYKEVDGVKLGLNIFKARR